MRRLNKQQIAEIKESSLLRDLRRHRERLECEGMPENKTPAPAESTRRCQKTPRYLCSDKALVVDAVLASAEDRGKVVEITDDEIYRLSQSLCLFCGAAPSTPVKEGHYRNGIDRLDNTKGYIPGNVAPCCHVCNMMKHRRTVEEFLAHVERVHNYAIKGTGTWQHLGQNSSSMERN